MKKIISGGQSGADIGALDAAIGKQFPVGGFCPQGRESQINLDPTVYPLIEVDGGYRQRTKANIQYSDATVIFYDSDVLGGSELTLYLCIKSKTPYKLIDTSLVSAATAAKVLHSFTLRHDVKVLNVAGPSQSRSPEMYAFVKNTIECLIDHYVVC